MSQVRLLPDVPKTLLSEALSERPRIQPFGVEISDYPSLWLGPQGGCNLPVSYGLARFDSVTWGGGATEVVVAWTASWDGDCPLREIEIWFPSSFQTSQSGFDSYISRQS